MKKIAVLSKDLKIGGIQRSLLNFLTLLDPKKYKVDCYLYDNEIFYKEGLPKNINYVFLKPRPQITKLLPFKLLKFFSTSKLNNIEYDYIIDYDGYQTDTALDAVLSYGKKKISWIHSDFLMKYKYSLKYRVMHFFMKSKYKYFDKFVAVSDGAYKAFELLNKTEIKNKVLIIPNYINTKAIFSNLNETCDLKIDEKKYNFISVGRICKVKAYDDLINILYELKKVRKDFHFYLIGNGEEKESIISLIEKKDLGNFVTLLGGKENPFKYENLMDGFILNSVYEGQGMVLMEAKALGLELFFPKHLEKYNFELKGTNNLYMSLLNANKKPKKYDNLLKYNKNTIEKIGILLK